MTTILWRRLDLPGHEIGSLEPCEDGWELTGTAVFRHEGRPCKLDYVVVCDAGWRTSSARVAGLIGDRDVALSVSVDEERRWTLDGADCQAVAGCTDIDLGFSPSTNLLPIRRLSLDIGEEAEVRAAWLPFPSLVFEVLPQLYRREGERTFRYEASGGRFVRTLEVNHLGFVIHYPGLWQAEGLPEGRPAGPSPAGTPEPLPASPIRLAREADLELVAALMCEFYAESGYALDRDLASAALAGLTADANLGRVWLILDSHEPVGYIAVTFGFSLEYYGRDAFIDDLFIRPLFRGAGLGTRVLEAVEWECRALGVRALHLEVGRSNQAGLALYHRQGFRDTDRQLLSKRLAPDDSP